MNFVTRFLGWGAASASMAAMSGTCPCCGNGLCPQGLALFGILGAFVGCALRLIYRPANPKLKLVPPSPQPKARHELALPFAERRARD